MDYGNAVLIIKALDCLTARSEVTAENIANAGTPNYRPLRVSFEDALKAAAAQGEDAVRAYTPKVEAATPGTADAELRIDLEMATASATAMRYSGLVEILNRHAQMDTSVYSGNV